MSDLTITVDGDTYEAFYDGQFGNGSLQEGEGVSYWCHILSSVTGVAFKVKESDEYSEDVITPSWLPVTCEYNHYLGEYGYIDMTTDNQTLTLGGEVVYKNHIKLLREVDEETGEVYDVINAGDVVKDVVEGYLWEIGYEIV